MELFIAILLFALGVVLIVKGGDFFVDAASWIAEVSGIPKLIVGATVVSIATTLPELLVSTFAASRGEVDMAVGNAVGSVTANIGLIMAIALIFMPSVIRRKDYALKTTLMLACGAVLFIFGFTGKIGLVPSLILVALFVVAIGDNVKCAVEGMKTSDPDEKPDTNRRAVIINILKFVFGVAGIVFGADLLVDNGSVIASALGVPERIIAITIVAVGTSLPELVTTLTAIAKKQASLSAGNIIGANIIDLALILPASALVSGGDLPLPGKTYTVDIGISLLVGAIALIPALISGKFRRWQGIALLAVYAAYMVLMCGGVI